MATTSECAWCHQEFHQKPRGRRRVYCSDACKQRKHEARQHGVTLTLFQLGERCDWICGICGGRIDPNTKAKNHTPSMRHKVPLSKGGSRGLDNLQVAHLTCSVRLNNGDREIDIKVINPIPVIQ